MAGERLTSAVARSAHRAREVEVLVRAGVLAPAAPGRVFGQLKALHQYGPTLAGAYAVAAARAPRRVALTDEQEAHTYAEVDQRARAVARGLSALGVRAGDSVALLGRNSVAFVEALVAVSRLGADALLLNTSMSAVQIAQVLARESPRVILTDADLLPLLSHGEASVPTVLLRPDANSPADAQTDAQTATPTADPGRAAGGLSLENLVTTPGPDPAPPTRSGRLVVLTSGTTGTPKGAKRPAPTSLSPAASMLSRLRLRSGEVLMIACPLFHTWGLGLLQIAPALAATVVLRRRADPELVLDALHSSGATALGTVPVILERLLHLDPARRAEADLSRLRVIATSGSVLTTELTVRTQAAFGDVLYNIYGSTEISWATIATPQDLREAPGTAGRPPLGTRLELVNENGEPVPHGQIGRIFVGNELLFEGYTSGAGRERLRGLMGTGDQGYLDPRGRLMVVGREDDLVISGAEKIYPLEVEETILALPSVREVAVLGVPDSEMGQRLVAYVVPTENAADALTAADIQEHVAGRLTRFAIPREVHFLSQLPRNATGKVVPRLLTADDPGDPQVI